MLVLPQRSTDVWALADCDSFFASCEVARRPALRGKQVCVCRDGDIVIAATYEAKACGVGTGTPTREARRLLGKDAVYLPPDMGYYGRVSEQVFSCLAEHVETLEQFSIDEAFVKLPPFAEEDECSYHLLAEHIQHDIRKKTGIPVTFGVAPTRLLAKTFAKLKKPYGVFVGLDDHTIVQTLQGLALTKTPFIAERTAAKLPRCRTMADFMMSDGVEIRKRLGRPGLKLWLEVNGIHALQIERQGPQRVISRCRSFHPQFTTDKELLWSYLLHNTEKAYAQLMDQELRVRYLHVMLRTKEFVRQSAKTRLPLPTADKTILLRQIYALFDACYRPDCPYRQTGIVFAELAHTPYKQYSVLSTDEEQTLAKQKLLFETIEKINTKRGKKLLGSAKG